MQTTTRRRPNGGRWARRLGIGASAAASVATVVAIATPASAASRPNMPIGARGSVAALSASSMEVQSPSSGQTTVTWTGMTQFSKTVTESVGSIAVGDCVTATGTSSKNSKTKVAARSVTVTTPSSTGTCSSGAARFGSNPGNGTSPRGAGGGGFAFGRGGEGGTRPSFPSGSGANNFRKNLANLQIASGKVTAVKGSTLTISGISLPGDSFGRPGQPSSKTNTKKPTTPKTQTLTVTTSGSTTVSATQSAAATDLAVGDCVSTFGPAATNGSVTATIVRITSTGGASCTGGFGARFGGPSGGGFPGPSGGGGFAGPGGGGGA